MPGKYLEYIKAGQCVVPIEITFLSTSLKDKAGKDLGQTSKWVEKNHWKEIKALLKPAVEAALKYNEQPIEKVSKSSHVSFGQEIGLGYVLGTNKDKSPFLAILDAKKNCWTDDEDEDETNENTRLRDYGGNFKSYTPTKVYISSAIIRRTASTTEDGKRLRKELGSINEDVRSYFQPSNNASVLQIPSGVDTTPITTIDKVNLLLGLSDSVNRKSGSINQALNQLNANSSVNKDSVTNNSSDSNSDGLGLGKKKTSEDHYDEEIRKWRYDRKTIPNKNDSFWNNLNVEGSYYEERDEEVDDDVDSAKGLDKTHGLSQEHNMQDIYNLDFDDDTFSLPDIDTPLKMSTTTTKPSEISTFGTHTFNTFGRSTTPPRDPPSNTTITQPPEKKKSPRKKSQHLSRPTRRGSSDDSDLLNEYDSLLYNEMRPTKKKRKRTNSMKHNSSITSITSGSYSGEFEEAIRAFEYRNETTAPLTLTSLSNLGSTSLSQTSTSHTHAKSPERKKSKESTTQLSNIGNFKKSPTVSPPRTQKASPSLSKVISPVHKPTTPTKTNKAGSSAGSPTVVRKIFSSSSRSPDITASPPIHSRKDSHHSEVQVISVKPKKVRKAHATAAAATRPESPTKSTLTEIVNIKKEKGAARKENSHSLSTASTSSLQQPTLPTVAEQPIEDEIDPEMPILELMVYNVPPPTEVVRKVKVEPTASQKAALTTPVKKKRKFMKNKLLKKSPSSSAKKNEATQTVSNKTAKKAKARAVKHLRTPIKTKSGTGTTNSNKQPKSKLITSTPMPGTAVQNNPDPLETPVAVAPVGFNTRADARHGPNERQVPPSSYGRTSTGTQMSSSSGSDGSDDLFSFDNLDKTPPKFFGPSVVSSGPGVATGSNSNQPNQPAGFGNMMPPPAKRPPRTSPQKGGTTSSSTLAKKPAAGVGLGTRPQMQSTVGTQVNPTQVSTFDLLSNPNLLRAGMGLLTKFNAKKLNSAELDQRIGLNRLGKNPPTALPPPPPPARPARPASPDICEGPPRPQKDVESQLMPAPARPGRRRSLSITGNIAMSDALARRLDGPDQPARSDSAEEESYLSDPEAQENGEALVRELMSRYNNRESLYNSYEPQGDEFDMSQRSYCMMNVVPDYQQKSRLFKIHSKNITALTRQNIVDQFQAIIPEMVAVFQGAGKSDRHKMYLLGKQGRDKLKEMNVSIPFHNDHGMTLITLLFEYFVPEVTARQHWTEYINYVMLPESFIRIYARVNDLSYEMAETEMRYGACYDDPDPEPGQYI